MSFLGSVGSIAGGFFGGPWGAAIGGAIGEGLDERGDARSAKKQGDVNYARQKEFAQQGIRWKVEDAKAAGVHPLYAIGGSGAAFAPNPVTIGSGDYSGPQQNLSRAMQAQLSPAERQMQILNAERMAAATKADVAQAGYWDAMAAKLRQERNQTSGVPDGVVVNAYRDTGPLISHPLYADAVKPEADTMVSRSGQYPGQTAGRMHPAFREFQMPNGDPVLLPATGQGGIPEEIDASMLPDIIGANIRRYGFKQSVIGALKRWMGGKYEQQIESEVQRLQRERGYRPGLRDWRR